MNRMLLFLLCSNAVAQQLDIGLLDRALGSIAALVASGTLSAAAEEAAVRRMLQNDEGLLLLTKHFGGMPSYGRLILDALGKQAAPAVTTAPTAEPTAEPKDLLLMRRSVKEYDTRAIPEASVLRALNAAVLAPNHFLTEPWRFYRLGPEARKAVAALNPLKQETFSAVPGWMLVTVAASEYAADGSLSTKKGLEDHAAVACAIQNFMLSLTADGLGSKWMTGALGIAPDQLLVLVGANATAERMMGMVWFGYPKEPLASMTVPARKLGVDGVHKVLD